MNQLRTLFAAVLVSFVLVGCGADQPEAPPYEPASPELKSSTVDPVGSEGAVSGDLINESLEAIGALAPLSVRYDRLVKTKEGKSQRQVYVEMLGASVDQTDAFSTSAFEEAGFTVRKGQVDHNGIRLQYKKSGVAPINVLIRDKAASTPFKNPAATSSLSLKQEVP